MGLRQGEVEDLVVHRNIPDPGFWRGKRVLLTGHTGFKGSWLAIWLHHLGAKVTGISLPPVTTPNLFSSAGIAHICESHFCDIRDAAQLAQVVTAAAPEIVFHLAAQPLVRASYREPLVTFDTNIMGTANLLNALRLLENMRAAVMVTTDKVYRNKEWSRPYREDDILGGHDPYSASKAASEIVIASYREAFLSDQGSAIASARAGNVIGGGDWSEDRLIPDAVRAWQADEILEIRRPDAVRPWQHVLEPLAGYLALAEQLWQTPALADAYNFGPKPGEAATVRNVVELAQAAYDKGDVRFGDDNEGPHEAGLLALEIKKSCDVLGVKPHWSLAEAITRTMVWYRNHHNGADARALCDAEITSFEAVSSGTKN